MIASAIMVVMMTLAWRTISNTSDSRRTFEKYEERNHEMRMALDRVVARLRGRVPVAERGHDADPPAHDVHREAAARRCPSIRFSTLGHRVLWADANESEQTVIEYLSHNDPEHPDQVDWIRREQRRQSNQPPEEEPSEYDVLMHDIVERQARVLELEEPRVAGDLGHDPERRPARHAAEPRADHGHDQERRGQGHQARRPRPAIMMQEPLNFSAPT